MKDEGKRMKDAQAKTFEALKKQEAEIAKLNTASPEVTPEVMPAKRGRPNKILSMIPRTLTEHAEKIKEYHFAATDHLAKGAMYAVLCGLELHAARARCEHGEWVPWVEKNCLFDRTTAWRYMSAAERVLAKISNVAQVQHLAELADGVMDDKKRQKLIAAVKDNVGDMTFRQLYLELGITKDSQHLPTGAPGGSVKLTQEQKDEIVLGLWREMVQNFRQFVIVRKDYVYIDPKILAEGLESIRDCVRTIQHQPK